MDSPHETQQHLEIGTDLTSLVERLDGLTDGTARVIIGLVGAPGIGKSTIADELARVLGEDRAVVVPMDGFHIATPALPQADQIRRRGAIDTFDIGGYLSLLARIRDRSEDVVYAPGFDRGIEEPIAGYIPVTRRVPIVITEGNYLLSTEARWAGVRAHLDETWYLQGNPERRRERLIARHIRFGKSAADARAMADGSDARNAEQVSQTQSSADLVIHLV
jgi:pantothenate kinase